MTSNLKKVTIPPPNIRDDEDGHLIYLPGDLIKGRCKFSVVFFFKELTNYLFKIS